MERRAKEERRRTCGILSIGVNARADNMRYFGHVRGKEEGKGLRTALERPVRGRRRVRRQRIGGGTTFTEI